MSRMLIDPPSGWMYGFPKEAPLDMFNPDWNFEQWCLDNGYPQELIDQGMLKHCRYIFQGNEREQDSQD